MEHAPDAEGGGFGKLGVAGVGHLGRQVEEGLLAITEMGRHDQLAGFGEAEALAHVLEAALHGERGRGEDHGGDLIEDQLVEKLGDVDGRGLQERDARLGPEGARAPGGPVRAAEGHAALHPKDHVAGVRFEQELKLGAQAGDALFEAGRFVDAVEALHLGFEAAEGGADGQVEVAGGFEELPRAR